MKEKKIYRQSILCAIVFLTVLSAAFANEKQKEGSEKEGQPSVVREVKKDYDSEDLINLALREELDELTIKYSLLEEEKRTLAAQVKLIERQKTDMSRKLRKLQKAPEALRELQKKVEEVSKRLTVVSDERDRLQKELDKSQKRIERLDKEIIRKVEKKVKRVRTERTAVFKSLQKENADLRDDLKTQKVKSLKDKNIYDEEKKTLELARLQTEQDLKKSMKQVKELQKELDNQYSERKLLNQKIESLETEIKALKEDVEKASKPKRKIMREKLLLERELYELKMKTDKERLDMHYNLAVVYDRNGMFQDAEREYIKCLQIDNEDADVHYNLGILYDDKLNNNTKALVHYKKYLALRPMGDEARQVKAWMLHAEQEQRFGKESR